MEAALGFLVVSPFSTALCATNMDFGNSDFRGILAWAPAEEETHLYLEVFGVILAELIFRGNFLVGVFLLIAKMGGLAPATPAFEIDGRATVTDLPLGDGMELACLGSTSFSVWLLIQVNLEFSVKDAPAWPLLD